MQRHHLNPAAIIRGMGRDLLDRHASAIAELCIRFGVLRLEAFGSAASGAFRPGQSDFDFLVELDRRLTARARSG